MQSYSLAFPRSPMELDFAKCRKTLDGLVSVIDVIAIVKKRDHNYAAKTHRTLLAEERVPEASMRPYGSLVHFLRGTNSPPLKGVVACTMTPVATADQLVDIIWSLPGTRDFRRNCATVCVRYLGGDETLVDEIRANRQAQQRLRD